MAYANLQFCWHGCISTDTEASKAFYTEVIGWKAVTAPMGDGDVTMFAAQEVPFAHLGTPPMDGVPSHWNSYLRVTDVDAAAARAVANGGTLVVPGTDIPPGRFAVVASPSGATFSLFKEADPSAKNHPGGEGGVHWVELHSHDLAADQRWLGTSFGLTFATMPMPDGTDYLLLKHGDTQVGGAMKAREDAPSMWLVWFRVGDVDAALDRARASGGKVLSPVMDMPGVGRMAILADPTGGVVGVITPPAA